jgi:hypothetical protein
VNFEPTGSNSAEAATGLHYSNTGTLTFYPRRHRHSQTGAKPCRTHHKPRALRPSA